MKNTTIAAICLVIFSSALYPFERSDIKGKWEQTDNACNGCRILFAAADANTMMAQFVHLKGKYAKVFNANDTKFKVYNKIGENRWRAETLYKRFDSVTYEIKYQKYNPCELKLTEKDKMEITCSGSTSHWKKI